MYDIHDTKNNCTITRNGFQIVQNIKGTLRKYGEFWFSMQDIANIVILVRVSDKYRVAYNISVE